MRISDWSSDVCSSDLPDAAGARGAVPRPRGRLRLRAAGAEARVSRVAGEPPASRGSGFSRAHRVLRGGCGARPARRADQPTTITASTSNAAPLGSAETSMVERAGYGWLKYSAITALTSANWPRLVRYRPPRATSAKDT